ncbi:GNAT family N-acetyltransferase [Cellulosimicrobium sp. Marseille-Q4280]|uniref:GNAT family N-acetyltransferase n=1 Tax=Cellulosimicrobium sp. Marseille-Q4280 TaxID=2937992 RepID=UPI002042569E|nr:GNAT family N-acetyltransferase [Cellulosimicrobium sp. Marseille-Q4280]
MSRATVPQGVVEVRPANEASWDDLVAVFGDRGYPAVCWCQRQVLGDRVWYGTPPEERARLLHEQTSCGDPDAPATSGLVAYLDGEPAGWVAVGPRPSYRRLRGSPVPWKGRPVGSEQDKDDDDVWAVACFVVRAGFRGLGLTYDLARAAVGFAREHGAAAIEGYPILEPSGAPVTWGENSVGSVQAFRAAGLEEVARPTTRRRVMRLDLG